MSIRRLHSRILLLLTTTAVAACGSSSEENRADGGLPDAFFPDGGNFRPRLPPPLNLPLEVRGDPGGFVSAEQVGQWVVGAAELDSRDQRSLFVIDPVTGEEALLDHARGDFLHHENTVYAVRQNSLELWAYDLADGMRRRVSLEGQDVEGFWLSPDASHIVYLTLGSEGELFVVPRAGGAPVQLSDTAADGPIVNFGSRDRGVQPLFAGELIVYATELPDDDERWSLRSARLDATAKQLLSPPPGATGGLGDGFSFLVSPDGEEIAFAFADSESGPRLYTVKPNGQDRRVVSNGSVCGSRCFNFVAQYLDDGSILFVDDGTSRLHRWNEGIRTALDGNQVAGRRFEILPGGDAIMVEAERVPLDGSPASPIVAGPSFLSLEFVEDETVLSDGNVLFSARRDGDSDEHLYVINFSSTNPVLRQLDALPEGGRLVGTSASRYAVSPDESSVAYLASGEREEVYWTRLDGSGATQISPNRSFAGTGNAIVFFMDDGAVWFSHDTDVPFRERLYRYTLQGEVLRDFSIEFSDFVVEDVSFWIASDTTQALLLSTQVTGSIFLTATLMARGPAGGPMCELDFNTTSTTRVSLTGPFTLDGRFAFFHGQESSEDPFRVYRADLETCEVEPLFSEGSENSDFDQLQLAPDGATLFVGGRVVQVDGSNPIQLHQAEEGVLAGTSSAGATENTALRSTPDGSRVVYATDQGIYSVKPDGTGKVRLDRGMLTGDPRRRSTRCLPFELSEDGSQVLLLAESGSVLNPETEAWLMPVDGSEAPVEIDLSELTGAVNFPCSNSTAGVPSATPSGHFVIQSADEIAAIPLDGSKPQILVDEIVGSNRLNGVVAVVADNVLYLEGQTTLKMIAADGGEPTTLREGTSTILGGRFTFLVPNGAAEAEELVFLSTNPTGVEVWIASLEDGASRLLIDDPELVIHQGADIGITPTQFVYVRTSENSFSELVTLDLATGRVVVQASAIGIEGTIRRVRITGANRDKIQFSGSLNQLGVVDLFELQQCFDCILI